ncbi:LysE family transporter [Aquicoccus sp. SCR17]|nr:LysE family transporter [Carideicomes alvinocaridis]
MLSLGWEHLVAFNVALLAALASPGPALLYALRTTLASGRAAGIATGAGLGLMAALWTLMALLGLDALFRLFPFAYIAFKIVGALYLIWIAVQTWRHARDPIGETSAPAGHRAFLRGMAINLANPKSVLFAAAVLVVIFPPDLTLADKALITLNHFLVELAAYAGFALLLSTRAARAGYLGAKPVIDRIAALLLGALGLRLLLDR